MSEENTTPEATNEEINNQATNTEASAPSQNEMNGNEKKMLESSGKSPILAAILSFIVCCIPGFGQFYLGQVKKGLILLIAGILVAVMISFMSLFIPLLLTPLGMLVPALAAYEAFAIGKKLESGESVEEDEWAIDALNDIFNK